MGPVARTLFLEIIRVFNPDAKPVYGWKSRNMDGRVEIKQHGEIKDVPTSNTSNRMLCWELNAHVFITFLMEFYMFYHFRGFGREVVGTPFLQRSCCFRSMTTCLSRIK